MLDAFFNGDLLGFLQRVDGCRRNVLHLVAREETAEVQGIVGEAIAGYPLAHPTNYRHVIVDARDDEVRQFYPHASIAHRENGVEHWL